MANLLRQFAFIVFLGVVAGSVALWVLPHPAVTETKRLDDSLTVAPWRESTQTLDRAMQQTWQEQQLTPAPPAEERLVARRISLALVGTIPSLEEWRLWESWPETDRRERWVNHLLRDRRSADYLAERLARAVVGTEGGPFLVFRRRRFVTWLSDQLQANRHYDSLVQELLTDEGLWTNRPAVNFVTATVGSGEETDQPNPVQLAARTGPPFLGLRLDCMQCHDDNLGGKWTQADFHQFAAFFAGTRNTFRGIHDQPHPYSVKYLRAEEAVTVPCRVPFLPQRFPLQAGSPRRQLAEWMTDRQNDPFSRAIVNRVWGQLFGKPLVEPVDSIPLEGPWPVALTFLANDFRDHDYDLQRLIRVITHSQAFGLASCANHELTPQHEAAWACFPMLRLRPEQVAGAIEQASRLRTINAQSHILIRLATYDQIQSFIRRYGDAGDQELTPLTETIPQNLLLMNGELVADKTHFDVIGNAASRIAQFADDDLGALRTLFLVTLSRFPSAEELNVYVPQLRQPSQAMRSQAITDIAWVLLNSSEFGWSH